MFKLDDLISELTQWIDDNIHLKITINDLTAHSGYSKWYLQRVFHMVEGKTIYEYIRDEKLYRVANDLVLSRDTLDDIRCRYGYQSKQSFTRSFTKQYNLSPLKYRLKHTREK
jgi:AraC-type DNA-binding domain-containing proteins